MKHKELTISLALFIVGLLLLIVATRRRKRSRITIFVASWCGHCRNLKPVISALQAASEKPDCHYTLIVVDTDDANAKELEKMFNVDSFPSIFIENEIYTGNRDADSIMEQLS